MSDNVPGNSSQSSLSFPKVSDVVEEQVKELLKDISDLGKEGYRVTNLLKSIGNAARTLESSEKLSSLDMIDIQNEVSLTKQRVRYSIGKKPHYHAMYHVAWIILWGAAVVYRSWFYTLFGGGDSVHIAIVGAISGAVGASLFALGGLYKHRIHLDLDEKFTMWYILKPVVGGVMGSFVGLMAGILVTGLGGKGPSPVVVILSAFGGMHEAWAMGLFQKYTNKALGINNPSLTGTNKSP